LVIPPLVLLIGSALIYRMIGSVTAETQSTVESIGSLVLATDSLTEPLEHATTLIMPSKEKSSENF
jgi:hypothetical protein